MAYGQTGSGKTYTVGTNQVRTQSDREQLNNKGIIQQSIEFIFKSIKNKSGINSINSSKSLLDTTNNTNNLANDFINSFCQENENAKFEYIVKASFVEIYNEEVIDLLNIKTPSKHIIIRNINNQTTLSGVSLINVNEPEDCYQLLNTGINSRKTYSTNMNEKSSRSHAIFTLYFEKICISQNLNESGTGFNNLNTNNIPINFKINFIDLAGSERVKKSGATGDRFKESISINSGLLALSKVIMALSENNSKVHVPYRDSKLTRILKDSLNGISITLILACISPSDSNYEETLNTLNYASFAKSIKVNPLINYNLGTIGAGNNQKYEEIINKLKNENFQLSKQLEEFKNYETKDNEILRLKNVIKSLKRKLILKHDLSKNSKEISSKKANDINLTDTEEENKMIELDKDSFLNISELINEEDQSESEVKEKLNNEFDKKSGNNKNEYEYMFRIKENNLLKRENEELKDRINNLLKENDDFKQKLTLSPLYAQLENVEDDINKKINDLNNLIDLNTIDRDCLDNPDYRTTKRNNVDTEISIKDLKAMEIDENKLEEESNFLLNYDNDLIIAQLSESLVNKKEKENIEKVVENGIFNKIDYKNYKNNIAEEINPLFDNNINNMENDNINEEHLIDVDKSIRFNDPDNYIFNDENKINTNDLKTLISKERMNSIYKGPNKINAIKFKNDSKKILHSEINAKTKKESTNFGKNRNLSNSNNRSMNSSNNSINSFNRKSSEINYNLNSKNRVNRNYVSSSNVSSNNCSQEKSNYLQFKQSINLKCSMDKSKKLSSSTMPSNNSFLHNRTLNNTSLNMSHKSEINKLKLQQNVALIGEKISKLREYQRKLKEKIIEAEIQKNKILKNKNEEISYMKKNVNDKQRVLKNLQLINDRNQKIIERSEHTINNLKIEMRNKSMEIRTLQTDNYTTKSISYNNRNINNCSSKGSLAFSFWNKFGKDNNGCCGASGHPKNFSHSLNNDRASLSNQNKSNQYSNNGLKGQIKSSKRNIQALSPSLNKSNTNNIFSFNNKSKESDSSKDKILKTSKIFQSKKNTSNLNTPKYYDYNQTINKSSIFETKNKSDYENMNEDKKIVKTLKFVLVDLEKLFLEKNKCQKRMNNLQNDKKEIIQLKKQNLDRYNLRIKALVAAKNRLENILKQEENYNNNILNSSGNVKTMNSFYAKLNTITNIENTNSYTNNNNSELAINSDNLLRSSCEKKCEYGTNGSAGNIKPTSNYNHLNTSPNLNDKSLKINGNLANIKIENVNNSASVSNSKEKNITANTNNYNQNIQKLTAIIYKISAVNERIERMNNLHESTLSEIYLSEEILIKQMKNIEASINRIKMQLTNSDYETSAKKDLYESIENLKKEFFENNYVTLSNKINNNLNKQENASNVENTELFENQNQNATNNTLANLNSNLNTNVNFNDHINLTADNNYNKKLENLFDKMTELKKILEDKEIKLINAEMDNYNKEKLIQDLQKKIDSNNHLHRNKSSFKNDNSKIKNEDYYCNYGNDKNLNLENSDSKKSHYCNSINKSSKNNSYVNINNTFYNISLTPQKINISNASSEKKHNSTQKYRLPPTDKKKGY